jgi:Pyridine nucleotide-disulphide oxidoreductase
LPPILYRQNHHCFQPLLYQVATAALSPADVAWPIRHILRRQKNATVLMAEVRAVDTSKRLVLIDRANIPYDYLVLATGATVGERLEIMRAIGSGEIGGERASSCSNCCRFLGSGSSDIFVSSLGAHAVVGALSAYSATKGAVDTLVKHIVSALRSARHPRQRGRVRSDRVYCRGLIEAGHLPKYLPDLNPIEMPYQQVQSIAAQGRRADCSGSLPNNSLVRAPPWCSSMR